MNKKEYREIPYNFTSADDRLIIKHIFGEEVWDNLQELRSQRITGKSARLVMRFIGDLFIMQRNAFLYQEMLKSASRRHHFFKTAETDLRLVETGAQKAETAISKERTERVYMLINSCREKLLQFRRELHETAKKRRRISRKLGAIVGRSNIAFDAFTLNAHATDATDWRLHLPVAVIFPDREDQVEPLLAAIVRMGLHIIPRGAGTGQTGGSVPLQKNGIVINTEKLNRISPIRFDNAAPEAHCDQMAVLRVESGVVTQDAMNAAKRTGYVFATDPTSSWASSIGGNISENAGGKTAVLWGTAIDNILSFHIVIPAYGSCTVRRVNHPMRKILPDDTVIFDIENDKGTYKKRISLLGSQIRKKGLWKDITNKALGGVPGIQKEGTDGVITSAEFVLHKAYEKMRTFCLEFFGSNMDEASRVIVDISREFVNKGEEALMALEHFDDEYIKAINYKSKAARRESPKAVLLIDMVSHTDEQLERGTERFRNLLEAYQDTELFIAKDEKESERYWNDRKLLSAIAARTNAFKLNEDIVLPLSALAEFARFVEDYNIKEDIYNQELFITRVAEYLKTAEPLEDPNWLAAKLPKADDLCGTTLAELQHCGKEAGCSREKTEKLHKDLLNLFKGYKGISASISEIYEEVRKKTIIIATHMHAGDGNVHVNIPVFSNDREMMLRAEKTAEDAMNKAVALGGVVSGEHGIGITKMKFLDPERIEELNRYRSEVDPNGLVNPGMLQDPEIITKVFTPSFRLLSLEARILQYRSLEKLSSMVAKCIRCGKCKPDCCVFIPSENVFFHPRNKNLAIESLIEAILYDMQRYHFARYKQLKNLQEIADHCTMCGKCLKPCPVDIDTAEVSLLEREILADLGYKKSPLATKMSLFYLQNRNRLVNSLFRKSVLGLGSAAQRLATKILPATPKRVKESRLPVIQMLQAPMAPPSPKTMRDYLPEAGPTETLIFRPKFKAEGAVFYFPGCGSERLYGEIGLASLYILLKADLQVVLPPPFLCCGFPAKVNAKEKMLTELSLRDTIILSQIKEMLGHLKFDAVAVSCGTCKEALNKMSIGEIFDCPIVDVSAYAVQQKAASFKLDAGTCFYHAPCHDSLDAKGIGLITGLGREAIATLSCCSEAGTMSLSRPDISGSMRMKKRASIQTVQKEHPETRTILTNCPSCITGLSRNIDLGIEPRHLAEVLAEASGGREWMDELKLLIGNCDKVVF